MDLSYLTPLDFVPNAKIQNFYVNLAPQNHSKRLYYASETGLSFSLIFSLNAAFLLHL